MLYVDKDITGVQAPGLIAHGVNCQNAMGSGVARALFEKWPAVKREYHLYEPKELGEVQFVQVEQELWVANCFTQEDYGRENKRYADPDAIETCLRKVFGFVKRSLFLPNEVHMVPIGCGLGGLDYEEDLLPVLSRIEFKYPTVELVMVDKGL